jgi:hypothetical protein
MQHLNIKCPQIKMDRYFVKAYLFKEFFDWFYKCKVNKTAIERCCRTNWKVTHLEVIKIRSGLGLDLKGPFSFLVKY